MKGTLASGYLAGVRVWAPSWHTMSIYVNESLENMALISQLDFSILFKYIFIKVRVVGIFQLSFNPIAI
jgi:hypothetical protein